MKHVGCQRVISRQHWAVLPVITPSITQEVLPAGPHIQARPMVLTNPTFTFRITGHAGSRVVAAGGTLRFLEVGVKSSALRNGLTHQS